MHATLPPTTSIRLPAVQTGLFTVSILHRQRWHETEIHCSYERALQTAEDAHRRSGLIVQLRDEEGTILFEASGHRAG